MQRIKKKKTSIEKYISMRFIGITFITAVFMALFITYFSDAAIDYDLKSQIRKESRYDYLNIEMRNGKVWVSDNFVYDDDGIIKVVLDSAGHLVRGAYPDRNMEKLKPVTKEVREITCGREEYFTYDRSIIKRDDAGKTRIIAYVRSVVNIQDLSSGYRTLKYASYICAAVIVLIATILASVFSRRIVGPIRQICATSEKIGVEKDLSTRIEYDGMFKEIEILAQANNRMLDRLEDAFDKQKQFSSDVTHELRTPVSVILAQCQYAKKHISDKEEFDEAISLIERQVKKTNDIISQILQLSRLDQDRIRIDFEYVDLRDIVEEVCESEKMHDEKDINLRLSLESAEARVDVGLIMAAIRNIINNAMKYSYDHSDVDVILKKENGFVRLMVRDYGCGMSENVRKHIFDRFYRADKARNSEGFGLGLSIAARIVEIHSGKITVESEEKKGSTFYLAIPEKL